MIKLHIYFAWSLSECTAYNRVSTTDWRLKLLMGDARQMWESGVCASSVKMAQVGLSQKEIYHIVLKKIPKLGIVLRMEMENLFLIILMDL